MVIDPMTAPHFTRPRHLVDAPVAIEVHKTPRHRRPGTWWIAMAVVLAAIVFLSGCTSDVDTYAAMQADLADAVHQAAKEAGK